MRILFVASEGLPFSKTGGLADVVEALPKALVAQGHDVAVVLPRYRGTKAVSASIPSITISMGGRLRFPSVADGGKLGGVQYFFVDDPDYTVIVAATFPTTPSATASSAASPSKSQSTSGVRTSFIVTTGKLPWF